MTVPYLFWLHQQQQIMAQYWYAVIILPVYIFCNVLWFILRRGITKDMHAAKNGEVPRNGIPHHGMLIIGGGKYLLMTGLWIAQIIITINLKMELASVIFGIANAITMLLLLGTVWYIARMERGYLVTVDCNLSEASEV